MPNLRFYFTPPAFRCFRAGVARAKRSDWRCADCLSRFSASFIFRGRKHFCLFPKLSGLGFLTQFPIDVTCVLVIRGGLFLFSHYLERAVDINTRLSVLPCLIQHPRIRVKVSGIIRFQFIGLMCHGLRPV